MPTANGLYKQVAFKREVTFGTVPVAASAQLLRRVESTLDLSKDTYQSNEIRPDFQIADFRHGVRKIGGGIKGELSPKTYSDFMAAILKREFAAVTAITAVTVSVGIGAAPSYTITRAAGSFLTDNFKVGNVVRLSVGSLNALNINKNLMVTAVTALILTVVVLNGSLLATDTSVVGCTITVVGKKTFVPTTGHTDISYAIEHFYSDLVQSEVFSGCKPSKLSIDLPPTGMATVGLDFVGKDIVTASTQYFTAPTALTATGVLASVNGVVRVGGVTVANLTGLSLSVDVGQSGDAVVGSNTVPALYSGKVNVTGQFTAYFDSIALRDAFINETEIDLYAAFTADNTATADFVAFGLPRIKVGSASKNDGDTGLVQTFSFQGLFNSVGGTGVATEQTTIIVQDSQA